MVCVISGVLAASVIVGKSNGKKKTHQEVAGIYIFLYFETTSFFVWGGVFAGVERVALPVGKLSTGKMVDGRNPKHH